MELMGHLTINANECEYKEKLINSINEDDIMT